MYEMRCPMCYSCWDSDVWLISGIGEGLAAFAPRPYREHLNRPYLRLTLFFSSLPVLKKGNFFSFTSVFTPVLGFLPV